VNPAHFRPLHIWEKYWSHPSVTRFSSFFTSPVLWQNLFAHIGTKSGFLGKGMKNSRYFNRSGKERKYLH
jgi:hypothetical protein